MENKWQKQWHYKRSELIILFFHQCQYISKSQQRVSHDIQSRYGIKRNLSSLPRWSKINVNADEQTSLNSHWQRGSDKDGQIATHNTKDRNANSNHRNMTSICNHNNDLRLMTCRKLIHPRACTWSRPTHVVFSFSAVTAPSSPLSPPVSPILPASELPPAGKNGECTICFDQEVDTVIYTCGHMCLCNDCGLKLKRQINACCPICRRPIKDVIKTYRPWWCGCSVNRCWDFLCVKPPVSSPQALWKKHLGD